MLLAFIQVQFRYDSTHPSRICVHGKLYFQIYQSRGGWSAVGAAESGLEANTDDTGVGISASILLRAWSSEMKEVPTRRVMVVV